MRGGERREKRALRFSRGRLTSSFSRRHALVLNFFFIWVVVLEDRDLFRLGRGKGRL